MLKSYPLNPGTDNNIRKFLSNNNRFTDNRFVATGAGTERWRGSIVVDVVRSHRDRRFDNTG